MKYFLVNKELDYLRGYGEKLEIRLNRIRVAKDAKAAFFFTRVFDSGIEGCIWHRFVARGVNTESTAIQFFFYACDQSEIPVQGELKTFEEVYRDPSRTLLEKKKILQPYLQKHIFGQSDSLLFEVKGRYMFCLVELFTREKEIPEVGEMFFEFPKRTWLELLPGIYSQDAAKASFAERFLAIFQTIYDDLDFNIRHSGELLEPKNTERAMLDELASWYGLDSTSFWSDERLRNLVRYAPKVTAAIGTGEGLLNLLELYTGERPILTECWKVAEEGTEEEKKIYGTDPGEFVISIRDRYITSEEDSKAIMTIIELCKPAHMKVHLRPLIDTAEKGGNTYLGINSTIGMRKDVT